MGTSGQLHNIKEEVFEDAIDDVSSHLVPEHPSKNILHI
jgi:hypothetical protein